MGSFLKPQPAGVNGGETGSVMKQPDVPEDLSNLLDAQDDGEFRLPRWVDERQGRPCSFEVTNASVEKLWQPFDDDDDRGLIEHCCIKAAKPPWDLGHPPQQNERAMRGACGVYPAAIGMGHGLSPAV